MSSKEKQDQVGVFEAVPGSGVWSIRVTSANGRRTVRQVGEFQDAVDAYLDHAAAVRLAVKRMNVTPYIDIMRGAKLSKLIDVAAEYYMGCGEAQYKSFLGKIASLKEQFGKRVAATLTTAELEDWLLDQADENEWSPATQNRHKFCLVVIFREGIKANLVTMNPARMILNAKEANRRIRFFSEEEEQRMRKVVIERGQRYGWDSNERLAQIDIALHTGMRKSEQFCLTWNRVHLKRGLVFLPKTKPGYKRYVFLNERSKAAFLFLKERHDRSGAPKNSLVFPDGPSTRWFENVLEEAGIQDAVWYTFRHTTASRLVMEGVHIFHVQKILGHRTLAMTFRYAHLAAGSLLEAVEKIVPLRRPFFGE